MKKIQVTFSADYMEVVMPVDGSNYLIKVICKVRRRGKGICLYFLKTEGEGLADIFNLMEVDEITEVGSGLKKMVDHYT